MNKFHSTFRKNGQNIHSHQLVISQHSLRFKKRLEVQAQVYDKISRENAHKPFNNLNIFGQNKKNISRINNSKDNRNSNAMNQFSNNSAYNWKQNSWHSSHSANQHGQPAFRSRKNTDQSDKFVKNAKEVTYSLHALNTRNVCQTKGMKL